MNENDTEIILFNSRDTIYRKSFELEGVFFVSAMLLMNREWNTDGFITINILMDSVFMVIN